SSATRVATWRASLCSGRAPAARWCSTSRRSLPESRSWRRLRRTDGGSIASEIGRSWSPLPAPSARKPTNRNGPMIEDGPPLEALTHRLAECPADFLAEPRAGDAGMVRVAAVVADLISDLGAQ